MPYLCNSFNKGVVWFTTVGPPLKLNLGQIQWCTCGNTTVTIVKKKKTVAIVSVKYEQGILLEEK